MSLWRRPNATWVRHKIPITYYRRGELTKVLPKGGWEHDKLRVYRLEKGEPAPEVDPLEFGQSVDTPVPATHIKPNCDQDRGGLFACCPWTCFTRNTSLTKMTVKKIMLDIDNGRDYYVTGANLSMANLRYVQSIYPDLDTDFIKPREGGITTFISNMRKSQFATPIHAAPIISSMAFQVIGSKEWMLFPWESFNSEDGWRASPSSVVQFPTQAPKTDTIPYYHYKSQPGDVMLFPGSTGHLVKTHGGPNFMVTLRSEIGPYQIFKDFPTAMHSAFNAYFFPETGAVSNEKGDRKSIHVEKVYNKFARDMINPGCLDTDPNNVDIKMYDIIMNENF